jgi:hypothetical protein
MLNSSTKSNQERNIEPNIEQNMEYNTGSSLDANLDVNSGANSRFNVEINSRAIEEPDSNPHSIEPNLRPNIDLNSRAVSGSNPESRSDLKLGPTLKSASGLSLGGHTALDLGLNLEPISGSDSQPNQETNLEPLLKCSPGIDSKIGSEIGFECGDGPQLLALAGIERLYSRGAWSEALQAGEALRAQLRLGAANPLRLRLELLIGHTLLYGLGERSAAERHYQKVQTHSGDPVLLAIAAQGLQRCGGLGADPPAEPQHSADAPPSCTSLRRERIGLRGSAFPPQAALASAPDIGAGAGTGTGTGEGLGAAAILSVAVASISPAPAGGLELLGPAAIAPAADPGSHAKPWLKRSSGEDLATLSPKSANTAPKNIVVVSNALASNTLTDNALAGNGLANNALTNKALAKNLLTNNASTNNAVANNAVASNALASNALASNAVAKNAVADIEIDGNTFAGTAIANSALASDGGEGEPSPMPWQGSRLANQPSSPGGPAAPLTPWRSTPGSEQLSVPRAAIERAATERAALYGAALGNDPGDGPVAGPAPEVNAAEMAELAKGLLLLVLD